MDANLLLLSGSEQSARTMSSALSAAGWRVNWARKQPEASDMMRESSFDVALVEAGTGLLDQDILWFLEEMDLLAPSTPLWGITSRLDLFDHHKILRRDVVLVAPGSSAARLEQRLTTWTSAHVPLSLTLADLLAGGEREESSARWLIEVEGQRLGYLDLDQGNLVGASAPGVRGARALEFFARIESADLYIRELPLDVRADERALRRWRAVIDQRAARDKRVTEMVDHLLGQKLARLGSVGVLDKIMMSRDPVDVLGDGIPEGLDEDTQEFADVYTGALGAEPSAPPVAAPLEPDGVPERLPEMPAAMRSRLRGALAKAQREHAGELPPEAIVIKKKKKPVPARPSAPEDPYEALYRQATLAYMRREYTRAVELFERCLDERPDDSRVIHNLSKLQKK